MNTALSTSFATKRKRKEAPAACESHVNKLKKL
jgi:hypothetical protein